MQYYKLSKKLAWISLLLLTAACSTPSDKVFLQKAEVVSDELLDAMADEDYDLALNLYDARFFERLSKNEWQTILKRLNEKLGNYQSRKITASNVSHGFSTISTTTTVLVYRVYYEKSYSIQKFTFMSDQKSEKMSLVGHYIDYPEIEK